MSSSSRNTRFAMATIRRAGSVISRMRLPLRMKRSTPSSSSSRRICLLIPGWEVCRNPAAPEKLRPCRAISSASLWFSAG
ncbi:hypothetical protein D3C83_121100 [compost metagenome]